MKIAILGFNIFGPGGTTRNNINLLNSFLKSEKVSKVGYINYLKFSENDVECLNYAEAKFYDLNYYNIDQLNKLADYDYLLITREDLYYISRIVKSINSKIKIIGEVHAPLYMLDDELDVASDAIDMYKVATNSIRNEFSNLYNVCLDKISVRTVSIDHLNFSDKCRESQFTKSLYIHSRFDEKQKCISKTIEFMNIIVNERSRTDVKLYLKGLGPDENKYKKLIMQYKLMDNVEIGYDISIPSDAAYLSTAKVETFGYSIIEALIEGRRVILSKGIDNVCYENFSDLKSLVWLSNDDDEESVDTILDSIDNAYSFCCEEDSLKLKEKCAYENYATSYINEVLLMVPHVNIPVQKDVDKAIAKLASSLKGASKIKVCIIKILKLFRGDRIYKMLKKLDYF